MSFSDQWQLAQPDIDSPDPSHTQLMCSDNDIYDELQALDSVFDPTYQTELTTFDWAQQADVSSHPAATVDPSQLSVQMGLNDQGIDLDNQGTLFNLSYVETSGEHCYDDNTNNGGHCDNTHCCKERKQLAKEIEELKRSFGELRDEVKDVRVYAKRLEVWTGEQKRTTDILSTELKKRIDSILPK